MHPVPPRSSSTSSPSSIAASAKRVHPSSDAVVVITHRHDGSGGGGDDGRASAIATTATSRRAAGEGRQPAVYTVWKRSSMGFQGTDGFSIYDAAGSLAFRVDNYSAPPEALRRRAPLMDSRGAPLLALCPQIFSMRDQWNCYRASSEESSGDNKSFRRRQQLLFSMRKRSLVKGTDESEVYMASGAAAHGGAQQVPSFTVQGSFWRRSCKIRNSGGEEVARITRKKAGAAAEAVTLGKDVFSITVMPDADCAMVMAFVVVMDRICQRPYKPLMCSS